MGSSRSERLAFTALAASATAWLAAVVAAPWLMSRTPIAAAALYSAFAHVCHQIPERSFHLAGQPFAVCHRCTGLYFGAVLGLILVRVAPVMRQRLLDRPRLIPAMALPLVVDWSFWGHTAWLRFATGCVAALPVAALLWAAIHQLAARGDTTAQERPA